METLELVQKVVVLLICLSLSWRIIKYIWSFADVEKDPLIVLVTGAAGQIGYALVPMIAEGAMLGPHQPVILHLLDIEPASEILKGVKMELMDGAFPLLKDVIATTDVIEACRGVDIAIMLGGFPRRKGDGKDLIFKNVGIYKAQASALDQYADPNCKVGKWVTMSLCKTARRSGGSSPILWVHMNPLGLEKIEKNSENLVWFRKT
ncbi:putative malate dehydrogenase [Helianthus anomalus]